MQVVSVVSIRGENCLSGGRVITPAPLLAALFRILTIKRSIYSAPVAKVMVRKVRLIIGVIVRRGCPGEIVQVGIVREVRERNVHLLKDGSQGTKGNPRQPFCLQGKLILFIRTFPC